MNVCHERPKGRFPFIKTHVVFTRVTQEIFVKSPVGDNAIYTPGILQHITS